MPKQSHNTAAGQVGHDEFVSLLIRYDRRLRSFISTLIGRIDDIDEVMQRTCLVAWQKLDTFRYSEAVCGEEFIRWLCSIARYEILSLRQGLSRLVFEDQVIDRLAAMEINEPSYFEDRHQALLKCIQRLRPHDRDIMHQHYELGKPAHDLAAQLGLGVSAIYKSLTRIRMMLIECVRKGMKQESGAT